MGKREKCNKISVYLIKEDIDYNMILKDYVYNYELLSTENSTTYYYPTKMSVPTWLSDYFKYDKTVDILNSRAKVISLHKLQVGEKERIFAIPFGSGLYLLNDDVIEEQFGLKVLLNSVSKDGFRKVNISNYGGNHRTKDEQMPKKADISEFGFDIYNDFLRRATAKSEEDVFSKNVITGGDLFSVNVPVDIDNVDEFLLFCYNRYLSDNYKENFSWLDNIKEVKEKGKKNILNAELLKQLNEHNFDKVWLAVPEVVDWEKISDFRFKKSIKGTDDIEITDFVKLFDNEQISDIEILKSRKVYAMETNSDEPFYTWSVYNCIIAEIEIYDGAYCLNYGKWYKVDKNFVNDIDQYYNHIPLCAYKFPDSSSDREDDYNEKLSNALEGSILFDKETIRIKGMGRSSIEVCDVYTKNNEFIHVKKNGGSSYLSHLFNQAAVSGEMLLDEEFRKQVNIKIGKSIFNENFNSNNYKIILAIITKYNDSRPKIPFFSKVAIRYAIDGLKRKGYSVEIKNIFDNSVDNEKK